MMDWVQSLPIAWGVAFLYVVILMRAGATYAIGRGARQAANRGTVAAWLESERVERATRIVNKWGAPVVAFSFLTVGFQTAANAGAGLSGMSLKRYVPALAIGGFAWAVIYATVGLAAIGLWLELFLRSPWAAVAALALVVVLVTSLIRHKRRTGGVMTPIGTGDETGHEPLAAAEPGEVAAATLEAARTGRTTDHTDPDAPAEDPGEAGRAAKRTSS